MRSAWVTGSYKERMLEGAKARYGKIGDAVMLIPVVVLIVFVIAQFCYPAALAICAESIVVSMVCTILRNELTLAWGEFKRKHGETGWLKLLFGDVWPE